MYELSKKIMDIITKDNALKQKIKAVMGVSEQAIYVSIKKTNGKSIANHYDAINHILDYTGLTVKDIRKKQSI